MSVWIVGIGVGATIIAGFMSAGRWWRRCTVLTGIAVWYLVVSFGAVVAVAAASCLVVGGLGWRRFLPASFERFVAEPANRSQRRSMYRERWADLMMGHGLARHEGRAEKRVTIVPRFHRRIECGAWADRLWVRPLVGQSIEDWQAQVDALAMALRVREIRVAIARPGVLRVEVIVADPLAAVVPSLPVCHRIDLGGVPVGVTEDGAPWRVRLTGNHVLVAGVTGAGKSSVVWSLIRGVAPLIAAGVVRLWGVDPKGGMELGAGRALFTRLAAGDLADIVELLEEAAAAMRQRAGRYAGSRRVHQASKDEPLLVVVVDELAFLTAYAGDNKLRDRANKALATLLTQGRAVGVCVVAALQDPRKEVIGYRNLFPTKIALRLDERTQVDMVLGDGARATGARCDQIPDTSPGVAYVKVDGIREPRRVRAGFVTDTDIAAMAASYPAPGAAREQGAAA